MSVFILLTVSCARMPVHQGSWQQPFSEFGGRNPDWTGKQFYDAKSGFIYGFTNDSANLYIRLKISSQITQRKLFLTGLTLWIDPEGKTKHAYGLVFPMNEVPTRHIMKETRPSREIPVPERDLPEGTQLLNEKYRGGLGNPGSRVDMGGSEGGKGGGHGGSGRGGGGMGGGRGGGSGGRTSTSNNGGMTDEMRAMSEPSKLWIKRARLAIQSD